MSTSVSFEIQWDMVRGKLKEILCKGGLGILWEVYCKENNVPEHIEQGFFKYLNSIPDTWFEEDWKKENDDDSN
jgi:hypothetical protein